MIRALSDLQTRMLRMRSQRLWRIDTSLANSPEPVIRGVCGVQAQDLPSGLLSVRPRSVGLTAVQVSRAREERALAWIWCMRGTLHLVTAEDARWMIPFFGPDLIAGDRRRLEQLGWEAASTLQGLRLLQEALDERGALTRAEIRDLLADHYLPAAGQAVIHLIYRAALEGILCYGPIRGGEAAFAHFDRWLGHPNLLPRGEALARLAMRYLEAYAPASLEDFASWSGLKLSEARAAWNAISEDIVQVTVQSKPAWVLKTRLGWLDGLDSVSTRIVRLLPRYDTYWLGYASRDLVVDAPHAKRVHPGGGQINAALLVDGKAAGSWSMQRRKAKLAVRIAPFARLPEAALPVVEAEVADLGRFLGEETVMVVEGPE